MNAFAVIIYRIVVLDLKVYLDGEQALTQIFYLKSFDMNSINVGKTEFVIKCKPSLVKSLKL